MNYELSQRASGYARICDHILIVAIWACCQTRGLKDKIPWGTSGALSILSTKAIYAFCCTSCTVLIVIVRTLIARLDTLFFVVYGVK